MAGFDYNGDHQQQSRPVGALLARANSLDDVEQALATDAAIAVAFASRWLDVEDKRLDETVDQWAVVRWQDPAAVFVREHMSYMYGPTYPWLCMTSAQLTEGLEAQQRHFDAMVAAFARLVRFPFVVNTGTEQHYCQCIIGLSPSSNLVGVRITLSYR